MTDPEATVLAREIVDLISTTGVIAERERTWALRWLSGETFAEIARDVGLSSTRVGQLVARAIYRLRRVVNRGTPRDIAAAEEENAPPPTPPWLQYQTFDVKVERRMVVIYTCMSCGWTREKRMRDAPVLVGPTPGRCQRCYEKARSEWRETEAADWGRA